MIYSISSVLNHFDGVLKCSTLTLAKNLFKFSSFETKFKKYMKESTHTQFKLSILQLACYINENPYPNLYDQVISGCTNAMSKSQFNQLTFQILIRFIHILGNKQYYKQDFNECCNIELPVCYERKLFKVYDLRHLQQSNLAGKGTFGSVYYLDNQFVVKRIKIIDEHMGVICRELVSLYKLKDCANTVNMIDWAMNTKYCYIFLERCCDNLKQFMSIRNFKSKTEVTKQILYAISEIHNNDLIHRDIKPQNILLKKQGNNDYSVKICDFGLSRVVLSESDVFGMSSGRYCCSTWYRPIECAIENKANTQTKAVDIWSIGCIIYELLNDDPLFLVHNDDDLLEKIFCILGFPNDEDLLELPLLKTYDSKFLTDCKLRYKDKSWHESNEYKNVCKHWDPKIANLIGKCLNFNPKKRSTISELINSLN